jgi:hypothetical protein
VSGSVFGRDGAGGASGAAVPAKKAIFLRLKLFFMIQII